MNDPDPDPDPESESICRHFSGTGTFTGSFTG